MAEAFRLDLGYAFNTWCTGSQFAGALYKSKSIAKLIGFPFFPISLRFPWFGLLGFIPFPTKWYIDFGHPIPLDDYGPDAATDVALVAQLTDKVRNVVQEMVNDRLEQRRSVFY